MKKGWKIFWLTCGITLVVGIALLGIGLGMGATMEILKERAPIKETYSPNIQESYQGIRELDLDIAAGEIKILKAPKEQQEIKTNREFYRMADSQTDEALCVDYEFKILKIDSSKGEITEIQAPEGYAGEPVVFGTVSEDGCLAGFLNDEQYEYCFMNELD